MDKNRIAAKIARLERELAELDACRSGARESARASLTGSIEHINTSTAAIMASELAMIIKCNAMISKLELEIAFLQDLME